MDDLSFLDAVLNADKYGWISKPKEKTKAVKSTELDSFLEIIEFYRENQREPSDSGNVIEFKLSIKLEKIRGDIASHESLIEYDEFNLLGASGSSEEVLVQEVEEFDTFEDILNSKLLEQLSPSSSISTSIFDIKNVPNPDSIRERKIAEQDAQRMLGENLEDCDPLFRDVH